MSPGPSQKKRRQRAQRLGRWAEWFAALALVLKAYRVQAIRYRTKLGEIDVIARKGDLVVVVEVKARRTVAEAVDSVGWHAQRRIHDAADMWLARQHSPEKLSIRFDIIAICPWRWPVHLPDAF